MQTLTKKEELSCTHCPKKYHYACLNISEINFRKTSNKFLKSFKCSACVTTEKKVDNSNTPAKSHLSSPDSDTCKNDKFMLEDLESFLDKTLFDFKNAIIAEIKNTIVSELNNNMKEISQELRSIADSHSNLQTEHYKLNEEYMTLKNNVINLEESLNDLRCQISRQQQWSRQQNIEVFGVPEVKNENPKDIIIKICNHAGVPLNEQDIDFANRVQPLNRIEGRPRVIVAKLRQRCLKDNVISGLKKSKGISTKDIGLTGESKPIYVNDHLTPENKALYKKCKLKAKGLAYKFVWTKNCQIFTRKNEKSPVISITSEKDLLKIV
ncbi:unnamed protein product [Parnassius mnemosyne]|uniref:FP protein C-terminal domain-containing protein n=1 Tax=Parnassius mnemosyne TaxID=213953 RepID=A0AAV1LNV2_9NEOP